MGKKDTVQPFFLSWLLSIFFFILLISSTSASVTLSDFETLVLFGSMGVGFVSYLIAFVLAAHQRRNHYLWALGVGFVLFFYVLFQMAN